MLKLPGKLTVEAFLSDYWQERSLCMPGGLPRIRPAITRNELGWLATLDDVESRIVFTDRIDGHCRYRAETGPFDPAYLQNLPKRDWTLLVHDVEKHLPAMRAWFAHVPFIPDWRIDDLMVSFAAPGGSVGPHKDHYDVFLCQGIGVRRWRHTANEVPPDPSASTDLALLTEFGGDEQWDMSEGDVLYLPPSVAHWGTAIRACITYSIGMRAPQISDLSHALNSETSNDNCFYQDSDLQVHESKHGYLSNAAATRATQLLHLNTNRHDEVGVALGRFATQTKDWLEPDEVTVEGVEAALLHFQRGRRLKVHGMSQIAFDDRNLYVNGSDRPLPSSLVDTIERICSKRFLQKSIEDGVERIEILRWMLKHGAFEIPENS